MSNIRSFFRLFIGCILFFGVFVCFENVVFSADEINKIRYAQQGAAADGYTLNCGDQLYITTCDATYCNYTKINGSSKTGKVYRNKIGTASPNCPQNTEIGTRYAQQGAAADGYTLNCGDKINVTKCDTTYCYYNKINGSSKTGKVYRNKIGTASPNCSSNTEIGTRYVKAGAAADGYTLNCGDKINVTKCDTSYCYYNKINGSSKSGKVHRDKVTTASPNCSLNTEIGIRYAKEGSSADDNLLNCGDKLNITTCDTKYCNYNQVNGETKSGKVHRDKINTSMPTSCKATNISVIFDKSLGESMSCDGIGTENGVGVCTKKC